MFTLVVANKRYSSWSLRPWLAMVHFGIPFEEIAVELKTPETRARILEHSPSGKVPLLVDHEVGVRVWESIAILTYLGERLPEVPLWPKGLAARGTAFAAAAEMHSGFQALRQHCPMNLARRPKRLEDPAVIAGDLARLTGLWRDCRERFGGEGPFLFGAFSAVDAMYAPVVFRLLHYAVPLEADLAEYLDAVTDLPATRRWITEAAAEERRIAEYEAD